MNCIMGRRSCVTILMVLILLLTGCSRKEKYIRVNQLGYRPVDIKVAVFLSKKAANVRSFCLVDVSTGKTAFRSQQVERAGNYPPFKDVYRLDFSAVRKPGLYFIEAGGARSPVFRIADDIYKGTADFLLRYMRQQQCGYNPLIRDSCHQYDGYIIYLPGRDSQHIDVRGGWHDASDYLQYVTTTATAVYQLALAYTMRPEVFSDAFDARGDSGPNGIPDVLDQVKWGLDWLDRMNPEPGILFHQIADDRDHMGFRIPGNDTFYSKGYERPVYFCSGQPQGIGKYRNRSTGKASIAGKFASSFALGSIVLKNYYPKFSARILQKAIDAYHTGLDYPGVCQTAPCRAPYFYEEENWTDDMELAASTLYQITGKTTYAEQAVNFGQKEGITGWMGRDTARHYQYYPFVNLGHVLLAGMNSMAAADSFRFLLKESIERVVARARSDPFRMGIPFIWCSNNLVSAFITQCHLYERITKDSSYRSYEAAARDWLFGCNPWGTSMITGLPPGGDSPEDIHSAMTHSGKYRVDGGLVDGPVYSSIFRSLKGVFLSCPDEYADVQPSSIVYHDDYADYSTNEPTMDGTASLVLYLAEME